MDIIADFLDRIAAERSEGRKSTTRPPFASLSTAPIPTGGGNPPARARFPGTVGGSNPSIPR